MTRTGARATWAALWGTAMLTLSLTGCSGGPTEAGRTATPAPTAPAAPAAPAGSPAELAEQATQARRVGDLPAYMAALDALVAQCRTGPSAADLADLAQVARQWVTAVTLDNPKAFAKWDAKLRGVDLPSLANGCR
jgi:hypothetical protein